VCYQRGVHLHGDDSAHGETISQCLRFIRQFLEEFFSETGGSKLRHLDPSLEPEWQGSFKRLFKRMTDATMSVPRRKYA